MKKINAVKKDGKWLFHNQKDADLFKALVLYCAICEENSEMAFKEFKTLPVLLRKKAIKMYKQERKANQGEVSP